MKYVGKFFIYTCLAFTIAVFVLFAAAALIADSGEIRMSFAEVLTILAISATIGATGLLFSWPKLPPLGAAGVQYLLLCVVFAVAFPKLGKIGESAADVFVMILIFTVLYAAIMGTRLALQRARARKSKMQSATPYRKIYGDDSKK